MKKRMLVVSALLALSLPLPALAQIRINFDETPEGAPLGDGAAVSTLYAREGVTLKAIRRQQYCCADPNVYVNRNEDGPGPFSGRNVVTLSADKPASEISEAYEGLVEARFDAPVDWLCIHVKAANAWSYGVLHVFDAREREIATILSRRGATQMLCASASNIRSVRFSGGGATSAWFDDLSVHFRSRTETPSERVAPLISSTNREAPADLATPVSNMTWGALKVIYR